MNRTQKEDVVTQLKADLAEESHLILAEYRGLTVEEISDFRSKVRKAEGKVRVVKNTLTRRALEGTDKAGLSDLLTGPNALIYTTADPVPLVEGTLSLPAGPGLGVTVDRGRLDRLTVEHVTFPG